MRRYAVKGCLVLSLFAGCSANVTGRSSPSAPPAAVDLSRGSGARAEGGPASTGAQDKSDGSNKEGDGKDKEKKG
jgi:hypothetical protein